MDVRELFQWYMLSVKQLTRKAYQNILIAKMAFADAEYNAVASKEIVNLAWLSHEEPVEHRQKNQQTKEEYMQRIIMLRAKTAGAGNFIK